jgi:hypothetical protein
MNDLRYDMEIQAFANEGFMVYEGIEPCEFKVEHIMQRETNQEIELHVHVRVF